MTQSNFRNVLEKFNMTGLKLFEIETASEVEVQSNAYQLTLSDHQFDVVCDFVYDWFMSSEASIQEIVEAVFINLTRNEFTLEDIEENPSEVECIINEWF